MRNTGFVLLSTRYRYIIKKEHLFIYFLKDRNRFENNIRNTEENNTRNIEEIRNRNIKGNKDRNIEGNKDKNTEGKETEKYWKTMEKISYCLWEGLKIFIETIQSQPH